MVGQKRNATVGGDMEDRIEGLRKSVAGVSLQMHAPKNHVGSESVNIFQVVCDLLDLMQQMNAQLSSHTHANGLLGRSFASNRPTNLTVISEGQPALAFSSAIERQRAPIGALSVVSIN